MAAAVAPHLPGIAPDAEAIERYIEWPAKLKAGENYVLSAFVRREGESQWNRVSQLFTATGEESSVRLQLDAPNVMLFGAQLEPVGPLPYLHPGTTNYILNNVGLSSASIDDFFGKS